MSVVLGSGEHRYRVVENWAKLPDGWNLTDVAAVGVDSKDRVYVFNRGEHPMVVLNRDGSLIKSWGEGLFHRAHGLHIDSDDNLYCTDDGDHTVRKCTPDGKVLLTIGMPVNRQYKNIGPRLTIVDSQGKKVARLGGEDGPGLETGKFLAPHGVALDSKGDIYLGEVGVTNWKTSFPETPMPKVVRCLQKLERVR